MALRKQTVHIPLAQGVDLKKNEINLEVPQLEVAHEVYFPNPGGISKRKGWTSLGGTNGQQTRTGASDTLTNVSYSGKGTLGMGVFDNKLFAMTFPENASGVINPNGNLWNWGDELGRWNNTPGNNSFEPLEIDSKTICDSPTEQYNGDAARYTEGNTTLDLVAWVEAAVVAWAIIDPTTDSVIYRSTIAGVGGSPKRPRVLVCDGNWQIWYTDDVNLKVFKIAADTFVSSGGVSVSTSTTTVLTSSAADVPYAVKRVSNGPGIVVAAIRNAAGTGYQIVTVDKTGSALAGPTTHGFVAGATSPIDIAVSPETTRLYVIRVNATPAVRADLLNSSTLAAVTTDIAVDSTAPTEYTEITAAFTPLDQGAGVRWCRVFISGRWTITVASRATKCYRLTSGGAAAVAVTGPSGSTYWAIHENLASHAFVKGQDSVYVFMCHRPESDSISSGVGGVPSSYIRFGSYHLWRHDGVMLCDFLSVTGGRLQVGGVEDRNHYLPQVEQLTTGLNTFRCVFSDRKQVSKIGNEAYGDRTIKPFTFDFDVPLVSVQLGRTAYLPNGMTYDGQGVYEQNFVHAPHLPFATAISFGVTGGAANSGLTDDVTYGYALIWEWTNANGEVDRSAVESVFTIDTPVAGGPNANDTTVTLPAIGTLVATLKRSTSLASLPPSLAVFRTIANPPDGSPYYRVTSLDPTAVGTNGYVYNDPTASVLSFTDGMPDATLITKDTLYISQGELAHFHPGVGKIISAGKNRLYSAGKEDGNQIFYSKNWEPGEVVSFSDALVVQFPEGGGDVTAIVPMDSQLVVFKKKQIYVLQGDGNDDTGSSGGYTNPQLIEVTVGCIDPKSIAQYPGGILFQSHKGIMNFTGNSVQYVGAPIQDYVGEIAATVVHPNDHMVLWFLKTAAATQHDETSTIAVLVYDYLVNQWATWGQPKFIKNAMVWNDTIIYMSNESGTVTVGKQSDTKLNLGGTSYNMCIITPWIKPADVQGFGRLWRVGVIGTYKAEHKLNVQFYYDYNPTIAQSYVQDWTPTVGPGVPCQVRVSPSRQLLTSFKIRISDAEDTITLADSIELASLALEIGQRTGIMRTPENRSL